jgi:hypothetical protein
VRRLLGWVVGLLSLAALARFLSRRRERGSMPEPPEPTTSSMSPPADVEPTQIPPDESLGARRADVHGQARATIDAMRDRPSDTPADDA